MCGLKLLFQSCILTLEYTYSIESDLRFSARAHGYQRRRALKCHVKELIRVFRNNTVQGRLTVSRKDRIYCTTTPHRGWPARQCTDLVFI
ncbi:hypothetical protein DFP73DRAFT_538251 [Morchella snyderi]|nr:hypothetical protein DFP73DRAFT_538251 [Morchella snyderi]